MPLSEIDTRCGLRQKGRSNVNALEHQTAGPVHPQLRDISRPQTGFSPADIAAMVNSELDTDDLLAIMAATSDRMN